MTAPGIQTRSTGLAVLGWRTVQKNTLRGFADIRLPNGLTIREVAVHEAPNGKPLASLPSKPMIGADGVAKRDDGTGKVKYVPILEWPDRATADRFSAAVIEAIEARYPGALQRQREAAR